MASVPTKKSTNTQSKPKGSFTLSDGNGNGIVTNEWL